MSLRVRRLAILTMLTVLISAFFGCSPSARQAKGLYNSIQSTQAASQRLKYRSAMENVLRQNAATASIVDLAKRVAIMHTVDTSACPPDFRTAYLDHTEAWEYMANLRRARDELASRGSIEDVLIRSLVAAASSSSGTPLEDLFRSGKNFRQLEQSASQKTSDTLHELHRVAIEYRARIPVT